MWRPQINLPEIKLDWRLVGIIAAIVAIAVIVGCWQIWKPKPPPPEVYKAEQRQPDGSVILEKKPDPEAKPKQIIPKGATVERVVSLTIQPTAVFKPVSSATQATKTATASPCPPVQVDLSLVRMDDKTKRVIASSPNGFILGGVDIPVEAATPTKEAKLWAIGATYNPFKNTYGMFLDRDLGPFRTGAEVFQDREGNIGQIGGIIKAGIRF